MAKVLIKRFLNASKEDNWDLEKEFRKNKDNRNLAYTLYELEVLIELDTETLETKVVGCDGKFLGDEEYSSEELYQLGKRDDEDDEDD